MQPDGCEVIARWREAGEWWSGAPPREAVRWRDAHGIVRESVQPLGHERSPAKTAPLVQDPREDWSLRPRKTRDEKVARANGLIAPDRRLVVPAVRSGRAAGLHAFSGYSFGRGAILASELGEKAAEAGYQAFALTDLFSLAGAWEFTAACRRGGVKPLLGAVLELDIGGEIVLLVRDKQGWESLSRLITLCHLGQPRLFPLASMELLDRHSRGLLCLTGGDSGPINRRLVRREWKEAQAVLRRLKEVYGPSSVVVQIERSWLPWESSVNQWLTQLAEREGCLQAAGTPTLHLSRGDFPTQDSIVCIHTLSTVEEVIGRKLPRSPEQPPIPQRPERGLNAERRLIPPGELEELYSDAPHLLEGAWRIAEMCDDEVLPGRTRLPQTRERPEEELAALVDEGARQRWGRITPAIRKRLDYELSRIIPLQFADHFLLIHDVCQWATDQNILYSGRGSVVDSAVAYCLGLTRIDAIEHRLHFDRFLPDDGSKRPDIDIDFEAKRRDDVRERMVEVYGRENVATVAAFGAFCVRGIVREVGKILGISPDLISFLAKRIHGGVSPDQLQRAIEQRPELAGSGLPKERLEWVFRLSRSLMDIPRNIRAHSSGVIVSSRPIWETVPVQLAGSSDWDDDPGALRIIQWDKRTAKRWFDKFDILCLRGQDVLSGAEQRIRLREPGFRAESAPLDDPESYRAMRAGELIGIPQSASPAMRQAHMRLRTQDLTDASLVQAGIRPGVGGAVKINELIARRRGTKSYEFPHPALEEILGHTYGIIVFQEQVDQLLQTFAGCTSGEAEEIREEIHKRRREDYGLVIRDELLARIAANGFSAEIGAHVFDLVSGFRGYGFAQGHALAFAEISIRSIHCQQNYPAEYFSALFDAQPAGYYGPCTLANEARLRGVKMLPPRLGASPLEFRVEHWTSDLDPKITVPFSAIRVGLSQIGGASDGFKRRAAGFDPSPGSPVAKIIAWIRDAQPTRPELEAMILIGFFDELHPNRRELMWAVPSLLESAHACQGALSMEEALPSIPIAEDFPEAEKRVRERQLLDLDLDAHLMAFERGKVSGRGGITAQEARTLAPGRKAIVVGNPIRLRFPPTPSGRRVVFFDLEDETGLLNVTAFNETYLRDGHSLVCSPYVTVIGKSQWRDGHSAFLASRIFPYSPEIVKLVHGLEELPVLTANFLTG